MIDKTKTCPCCFNQLVKEDSRSKTLVCSNGGCPYKEGLLDVRLSYSVGDDGPLIRLESEQDGYVDVSDCPVFE